MHIADILTERRPTISFEFFPPKSPEAMQRLFQTIAELAPLKPDFVSITYGAGGSTRELTRELVAKIKKETEFEPIPHLTCIGHRGEEIYDILVRYSELGISNILALRGDPPKDRIGYDHSNDEFPHAIDLVKFIRAFQGHPDKRGFGIGVAGFPEGHPATPNRLLEMEYLKAKVDAGADYICTQLFFDNHDFFDFCERCELAGISVPIIAGIMPVTSLSTMRRMAELAGGSRFPAKLLRRIAAAGDDPFAVEKVGIEYAVEQCRELIENSVAGLHFYTLNQSSATREICRQLNLQFR